MNDLVGFHRTLLDMCIEIDELLLCDIGKAKAILTDMREVLHNEIAREARYSWDLQGDYNNYDDFVDSMDEGISDDEYTEDKYTEDIVSIEKEEEDSDE